jgi:hypothetical protein
MTFTKPAHFRELRWLRRQLEENVHGFDDVTLAALFERQDRLERKAAEENVILDLNGAIGRGGNALGAYLTAGYRLQRWRDNEVLKARGWKLPWDDYPADLESPMGNVDDDREAS